MQSNQSWRISALHANDHEVAPSLGPYIFGCLGHRLTVREKGFFRETQPIGFILFDRNLRSSRQIKSLIDELRETVGFEVLIMIDQEGGRVQRLRPPHWRQWLPPLDICSKLTLEKARKVMWMRYRLIADELRQLGIDTNCVPIADTATDDTHPVLKNRCYGMCPADVGQIARGVADGCLSGGVLPVLKHIPGHGSTNIDSHAALPVCTRSLDELRTSDFRPFRELHDVPLGMTAHVLYREIDANLPATVSHKVISIIREDLNFAGLLMTDDLSMSALEGNMATRTEMALQAGCDVMLHCNGDFNEMNQVALKAGSMSAGAWERAQHAFNARSRPSEICRSQLEADHEQMIKDI